MLYCLVDESGSLSREAKEPLRVGFLMTCHPERLHEDICRLKREMPPRGKSGEFHAREDDSSTKDMLRKLLSLNREPQLLVVEWHKDKFSDNFFVSDKLRVFDDSNPLIASFAVTTAEIAAAASAKGMSGVHVIVEAGKVDVGSEHRSQRQALNQVLPVMFQKQAKIKRAPAGTKTFLQVSTVRKKECPSLSFVDSWLWAYARHHDQGDPDVLSTELEARTTVRVMTQTELLGSRLTNYNEDV